MCLIRVGQCLHLSVIVTLQVFVAHITIQYFSTERKSGCPSTNAVKILDLQLAVKEMTACSWDTSQKVIKEKLNKGHRQRRLQLAQQYVEKLITGKSRQTEK